MRQQASKLLTDASIAILAIATVIFSTLFLAGRVIDSPVYRQSRIVSLLLQQESFRVSDLLENTRDIELVLQFAGALATAYINFEMIPVDETATFVSVFESLNDDVYVEGLEYRRKDLAIAGRAESKADYERFLEALRERDSFASVEGSSYDSTNGGVRFEILCIPNTVETSLNFSSVY